MPSRLRWAFWKRRRSDADFADEIAAHLALETDQLEREGMPARDARAAARRGFGNVTAWKEWFHDSRRILLADNVVRDLRHAWRSLLRAPSFTLVVALTLAIGIGANTAVVTVIDAIFLRKLPVPAPERIFAVFSGDVHVRGRRPAIGWNSLPDYLDIRTRLQGTDGLAAYSMQSVPLGDSLAGTSAWSALVSGNYFQVLGVHAARGRLILPDEEEPRGAHPVAVISDALWKSRFAADEHIVGTQMTIGTRRFAIVGVAPAGFTGTHPEGRTDLWIPITMYAEATGRSYIFDNRDARQVAIIGRLANGATLDQVQTSLDHAVHELVATYPAVDAQITMSARPHEHLFEFEQNPSALASFLFVLAMVALLHLVACANIASLVLARAAARRHELGIRLCLGASRGRVIMQSLAEPVLLGALGAAGGVAIARWITLLITSMQFMSAADPGLDLRVIGIVGLVSIATVVEFGLVPALEAARRDPLAMIRGSSGARVAGRRDPVGPILVVAQVAMSLVLIASAATLFRTFEQQSGTDPGFDARHVLLAALAPKNGSAVTGDWAARTGEITKRVESLPGVTHVAIAGGAPLGPGAWYEDVSVAGHQYAEGESRSLSGLNVGPGYFAAIGAAIARGREFTDADRAPGGHSTAFSVAVVNEAMARRFWPGEDPVGKQISYRSRGSATVVGVVRDMHDVTLSAVVPRVYFPLLETPATSRFELIVRTASDPATLRSMLRTAIVSSAAPVDPPAIQTMAESLDGALSLSRAASVGLGTCGAIALLLTAIGLYGLVASWSAERRGEIGIRIALGAEAWQGRRLLVGGVARLIVAGAAIGIGGAVAAIRLAQHLYGPAVAFEAWPLAVAFTLLAGASGLAAYIPSRRATAVDPAAVLRNE